MNNQSYRTSSYLPSYPRRGGGLAGVGGRKIRRAAAVALCGSVIALGIGAAIGAGTTRSLPLSELVSGNQGATAPSLLGARGLAFP
jgi:hypothetical protein